MALNGWGLCGFADQYAVGGSGVVPLLMTEQGYSKAAWRVGADLKRNTNSSR